MHIRRIAILLVAAGIALVGSAPARAAAPPVPQAVQATPVSSSNEVSVGFGAVPGALRVAVYRGDSALFVPGPDSFALYCPASPCRDNVPASGTYYYKLVAESVAGERSAVSAAAGANVFLVNDRLPNAAISSPAAGATVSGIVPVAVTAGSTYPLVNAKLYVDGVLAPGPDLSAFPGTIQWDSTVVADGPHDLRVLVRNTESYYRTLTARVVVDNTRSASLVAAYGMDDGVGTVTSDGSGRGKTGTIRGGTWTAGRYGGALALDGSDDDVVLPNLGTFYKRAFTLEAWVRKTGGKRDAGVLGTWDYAYGGGPMLWVDYASGRYVQTVSRGAENYLDSGQNPAAGTWQHLTSTYDGDTLKTYVDGVEVAGRGFLGNVGDSTAWRIGSYGANTFDGAVDEVRIYKRALTGDEVRADMGEPVEDSPLPAVPDQPNPQASVGADWVRLTWSAVPRAVTYNVYRGPNTGGWTLTAANRIAHTADLAYTDTGLAAGGYMYVVVAENAAGEGMPSTSRIVNIAGDTKPPKVSFFAPKTGATLSGTTDVTLSASDDVGISEIEYRLDGRVLRGPTTASSFGWDTTTTENGSHTLTAVARDAAGNQTEAVPVSVTVANAAPEPGSGLVAAYSFDDGTARDTSGNGHDGTIAGGARAVDGRQGGALDLDGADDRVDLPPLGTFYQQGFTYEAWVRKSGGRRDAGLLGTWTESGGGVMIWADHIDGRYRVTAASGLANYLDTGTQPAQGEWQHITASFDGRTMRFYVDGEPVASHTYPAGPVIGTSDTWRIGAYGATPGFNFDGTVDEVRIYDRALTATEIRDDMAGAGPADTTPPAAPTRLRIEDASPYALTMAWDAVPDDGGEPVTKYIVYRDGARIGEATAPRFQFAGLTCGRDYRLGVEARDRLGRGSDRVEATVSAAACPPGGDALVAAYGFEEGSGTVAADASGHLHAGTLAGASFAPGRHGQFGAGFGGSGRIDLPALGTFYKRAFTLEAWVKAGAGLSDSGIVGTWDYAAGGGPMLWVDHVDRRHRLTLSRGMDSYLDSLKAPVAGTWQHLAATYDGAYARYYVDGAEVAAKPFIGDVGSSDVWRIGAYGASPAGFLKGTVDDVRIFSEARSAAEVLSDMETPVG